MIVAYLTQTTSPLQMRQGSMFVRLEVKLTLLSRYPLALIVKKVKKLTCSDPCNNTDSHLFVMHT